MKKIFLILIMLAPVLLEAQLVKNLKKASH